MEQKIKQHEWNYRSIAQGTKKQLVIDFLHTLHRDLGEPKTFEELQDERYGITKVLEWTNEAEQRQPSWNMDDDDIQGKLYNIVCSDNRLCESDRITLLKWLKGLKGRMIG